MPSSSSPATFRGDVLRVTPLGAGQDVGRSCIVVEFIGENSSARDEPRAAVMLDCGVHMGEVDKTRMPDFGKVGFGSGNLVGALSCVLVTHFHLDHCGALPVLTEEYGYRGPIIMTHPTKELVRGMLETYAKLSVAMTDTNRGANLNYDHAKIKACLDRVTCVNFGEVTRIDVKSWNRGWYGQLEIQAHRAGHVLGAAMFSVRCRDAKRGSASIPQSIFYTGDFNMSADRHLDGAKLSDMNASPQPERASSATSIQLLITESTYGDTVRNLRGSEENKLLQAVHSCVDAGGKVLIPVFAVGRVWELCCVLDAYWERMGLGVVPIHFSLKRSNPRSKQVYEKYSRWAREDGVGLDTWKHVKLSFDNSLLGSEGPMVLLATPGFCAGGLSRLACMKWAPSSNNLIVLPGHCPHGTVGAKLQRGNTSFECRESDGSSRSVRVECRVISVSFSAHTDRNGIMKLARRIMPSGILLVHGQTNTMEILAKRMRKEFGCAVVYPKNGESIRLRTPADGDGIVPQTTGSTLGVSTSHMSPLHNIFEGSWKSTSSTCALVLHLPKTDENALGSKAKCLEVRATMPLSSLRFSFNLCTGKSFHDCDVLYHFNPRFWKGKGNVVHSQRRSKDWSEIKRSKSMPERGKEFVFRVFIKKDSCFVTVHQSGRRISKDALHCPGISRSKDLYLIVPLVDSVYRDRKDVAVHWVGWGAMYVPPVFECVERKNKKKRKRVPPRSS